MLVFRCKWTLIFSIYRWITAIARISATASSISQRPAGPMISQLPSREKECAVSTPTRLLSSCQHRFKGMSKTTRTISPPEWHKRPILSIGHSFCVHCLPWTCRPLHLQYFPQLRLARRAKAKVKRTRRAVRMALARGRLAAKNGATGMERLASMLQEIGHWPMRPRSHRLPRLGVCLGALKNTRSCAWHAEHSAAQTTDSARSVATSYAIVLQLAGR
mmetsp:Transcript_9565/g.17131  ORF Transcript_9565/g.17131 Transcript_9565/m.17131 type:complete len:218 (-) Transcript_9565:501-1154(-)